MAALARGACETLEAFEEHEARDYLTHRDGDAAAIGRDAEGLGSDVAIEAGQLASYRRPRPGSLVNGERIELRGFGVFLVKRRKSGIGRNPKTGEVVQIPPGWTDRFKPGKDLQNL